MRNVAIIAHVDHGKTTLVDAMLKQTGIIAAHEQPRDRVLDSEDLERERGITILAKIASVSWQGERINIIDTPGHADFGGEVERTLRMAEGALLLVDAAEGPLPQTRFVLSKAIGLQMPIILVVNKIDRSDARPDEVVDEAFSLFCDLGASDEQADFPVLYAIGKEGIAKRSPKEDSGDLRPLFETLMSTVPPPSGKADAPMRMLVHQVGHDDYVGRLAIGKVVDGELREGQTVSLVQEEGRRPAKASNLWGFHGLDRKAIKQVSAGDLVAVSGIEEVQIGDTLAASESVEALPRIEIEEPTLKVQFVVNSSPMAGKSGQFVTSRQVRDRLFLEAKRNIALRVEEGAEPDRFVVAGRGELMLAVLAETLRRESFEFALAPPEVVTRLSDAGAREEPIEWVVVDVADDHVGKVTTLLGGRKGQMVRMMPIGTGRTRVEYRAPSRALLGFRANFLTETRGTGILHTIFDGWEPWAGPMLRRQNGALVADRSGVATPYALFNLQPRGVLFIEPGTEVYEGMVIGEHNRPADLDVNVTKEKKLTNIRAAGRDENVILTPPRRHTIDSALEFIDQDELVEVTPDAVRIRKAVLACNRRPKRAKA